MHFVKPHNATDQCLLLCAAGLIICKPFEPHFGRSLLGAVLQLDLIAVRFLLAIKDTQECFQLRQRKWVPLKCNTTNKRQFKQQTHGIYLTVPRITIRGGQKQNPLPKFLWIVKELLVKPGFTLSSSSSSTRYAQKWNIIWHFPKMCGFFIFHTC